MCKGKQLVRHFAEFRGFCEGDDTITAGGPYNEDFVRSLGLKLKSEVFTSCSEAGFCGIVRPPGSTSNVTDPVKVLCNFFYLPNSLMQAGPKKEKAYMRAKALSYYCLYPACPVISELAYQTLRLTKSVTADPKLLSYLRKRVYDEMDLSTRFYHKPPEISVQTRHFFEGKFGIGVDEQLVMERQLRDWGGGGVEQLYLPPVFQRYRDYACCYVRCESSIPVKPPRAFQVRVGDEVKLADGRKQKPPLVVLENPLVLFEHGRAVKASAYIDGHVDGDPGVRVADHRPLNAPSTVDDTLYLPLTRY